MYKFLLYMWVMKKITEYQVGIAATKGLITEAQKAEILTARQVG